MMMVYYVTMFVSLCYDDATWCYDDNLLCYNDISLSYIYIQLWFTLSRIILFSAVDTLGMPEWYHK